MAAHTENKKILEKKLLVEPEELVLAKFTELVKPLLKSDMLEDAEALLLDAAAGGPSRNLVRFCLGLRERVGNRKTFEEFAAAAAAVAAGRRRPPWWSHFASSTFMVYLAIPWQPLNVNKSRC
jgi:hypothetical protein